MKYSIKSFSFVSSEAGFLKILISLFSATTLLDPIFISITFSSCPFGNLITPEQYSGEDKFWLQLISKNEQQVIIAILIKFFIKLYLFRINLDYRSTHFSTLLKIYSG